jgi:hypothetical protein
MLMQTSERRTSAENCTSIREKDIVRGQEIQMRKEEHRDKDHEQRGILTAHSMH